MLEKLPAKKLFIGGGVLLLAGALFGYMLCAGHREGGALKVLSDKVDFQIKDFHYTEVGNPDLTWEIDADTATYSKKDDITLFENVKIRLIFPNGNVYVITGEHGSLHTRTKNIEIQGNVVALSDDGERFETASLSYSHRGGDGVIHTKDAVMMVRPGAVVQAVGMHLSPKGRRATLLSDVRATINRERR